MARGKRKKKLEDLPACEDPRAPLDAEVLLAASQGVVKLLRKDLTARAKASAAVTEALKARHAADKKAQRTADTFSQWQERFIEQVAAAWLLSCVFVRTLEDRGLLGRARIAGEGAADSQRQFFEIAPSLTERDYLLTVFRELSHFAAAKDLFDAQHNPVWLLAPSAEAAKALLGVFRTPSVDAPSLRFGQEDTRFVGDLYQDLDEGVRKRYALLQTPRFVESFILDRTLEPAIEKFGLDDTTVIDPTCGSGHFLLGSFERLLDHRLRLEPGLAVREAAARALDAVFGADINPYAVAISRFRLTLAFLEKAGFGKLADAPRLPLHLVVADSLLHNPHAQQLDFGDEEGQAKAVWRGEEFALEDEAAARDVLHRRYAAVVGNPPYITVKDKVLRDRYRGMYPRSAAGTYSVAAPFTERLFQLGRAGGRVGVITANSFMKREFGKKLIREFLPTVNLDAVVNTSGAYIPGHGTPTVLLFGSAEGPVGGDVLTVLASRGEPSTPDDPERGEVWGSIAAHWDNAGFENDYISVTRTERDALADHPWSLAGGGATELKTLLEERASSTLGELVSAIGRSTHTGEDGVFFMSPASVTRLMGTADASVPLVKGEQVRDWALAKDENALFPYDLATGQVRDLRGGREANYYWRYRTVLRARQDFGQRIEERGLRWYEHSMFFPKRYIQPLSITFAFVATHNHFVLDRGGKVFNRTAPIIKLPDTATEDDHLALLAYLNSSTACFWMKQVSTVKGLNHGSEANSTAYLAAYEFDGTKLKSLPLPELDSWAATALEYASELDGLRRRMSDLTTVAVLKDAVATEGIADRLAEALSQREALLGRAIAVQEELDWLVYQAMGVVETQAVPLSDLAAIQLGDRPFEIAMARAGETRYFEWHGSTSRSEIRHDLPSAQFAAYERRLELLGRPESRSLKLLENPDAKRRWAQVSGKAGQVLTTERKVLEDGAKEMLPRAVEAAVRQLGGPFALTDVARELAASRAFGAGIAACECLEVEVDSSGAEYLEKDSVPFLSACFLTNSGLGKLRDWELCWEAQRREDDGSSARATVPPKFGPKDFGRGDHYSLRGRLNVPKERFISYPHCESDENPEPIYGWAGWDHEQRAKALATLYWNRKTEEGWEADRLTPMLAGLLELLPWLHQWHAEQSEDYGGDTPANYYDGFLNGQCAELGLTHEELRAWRPPAKKKAKGKTKAAKKNAAGTAGS